MQYNPIWYRAGRMNKYMPYHLAFGATISRSMLDSNKHMQTYTMANVSEDILLVMCGYI